MGSGETWGQLVVHVCAALALHLRGTEADLRNIDQAPARGIGFLLRANNEQQQALIRATILELIAQNNEERRAIHEEFNKKVFDLIDIALKDARKRQMPAMWCPWF